MKKTYGYARVSTREQHLDRQLKALMDAGVEERDIITDKVSGKDLEREGYQSLKNHFLRDGDTLIVKSLDRLSRRKIDIKKELEYFREHHIRIKILDIPTTMVELPDEQDWIFEMINNILIEVLASILLFSKGTFSPLSMIISLKEFTKYPLSLFNDGIVVLLTWIIPIAITSYYPTLLFLGDYSIIGYSASTSAFFRVRTNSVS